MNPLLILLRLPHFRAQARLSRDMRSSLRLQFLCAGIECGLFDVLRNPVTQQAIVEGLQVRRPGVSFMQGGSVLALDFDLVLRSTVGCARLPAVDELVIHLREAGFGEIITTGLMPAEPLFGVIARVSS